MDYYLGFFRCAIQGCQSCQCLTLGSLQGEEGKTTFINMFIEYSPIQMVFEILVVKMIYYFQSMVIHIETYTTIEVQK